MVISGDRKYDASEGVLVPSHLRNGYPDPLKNFCIFFALFTRLKEPIRVKWSALVAALYTVLLFGTPYSLVGAYIKIPGFNLPITPYFKSNGSHTLLGIPRVLSSATEPLKFHMFTFSLWYDPFPSWKIPDGLFITVNGLFKRGFLHLSNTFFSLTIAPATPEWLSDLSQGYL